MDYKYVSMRALTQKISRAHTVILTAMDPHISSNGFISPVFTIVCTFALAETPQLIHLADNSTFVPHFEYVFSSCRWWEREGETRQRV